MKTWKNLRAKLAEKRLGILPDLFLGDDLSLGFPNEAKNPNR